MVPFVTPSVIDGPGIAFYSRERSRLVLTEGRVSGSISPVEQYQVGEGNVTVWGCDCGSAPSHMLKQIVLCLWKGSHLTKTFAKASHFF